MRRLLPVLVILLLPGGLASAQQPMDFDALYGFDQLENIRLSPTGQQLAYTLTHNDLENHTRSSATYLLDLKSGETRRLSDEEEKDSALRWLADGKRLWFPDGDKYLFTSSVYPDCPDDDCNRVRDSLAEHNPVQAKLYDHLLFRHYSSWDDGKVRHLFLGFADTTAPALDLTPGRHSVPAIAGGGWPGYTISPDGGEICFAMNTDSVIATSYNNDLYIMPPTGGNPTRITTNPGSDGSPMYSPDGKYLAYYEMARPGYESDQKDIILINREDSTRQNLTAEFDRSVFEMVFSPDSKHIYFTTADLGFINIFHVATKGSEIEEVIGGAVHGDLNISPDGKTLYFTRSESAQPTEIYSYHLHKKELTRLTFHTQELVERTAMRPSEEFWYYSVDSLPIQGFITYPPDFDPTRTYPLTLLIHGGPQWCWLNDFNYYGWNTHRGDWGGKDFQDLMIGIDYVAERFTFIDTTRMAALGRSYGGFMVNWICGQTDRFKCLIGIDGTFEQISDYYSTEELWFPEWEFNGTPWTNRELYLDRSPERFVANFKTPTLVIHGQYDYRVDISQGIMMFTALQRRGVPSQFLYFPDEGHSIRNLRNLRHVYEVQLEWLAKYLK